MDFKTYQRESRKTADYPDIGESFVYPALGLSGEAGEVVEQIKKVFRDDNGEITWERRMKIVKEMGDVLWYLANLATELDLDLDGIAKLNLEKLQQRKEHGLIHGDGSNR